MGIKWQGRLRSIFAFSFPVLLGILFFTMLAQANAYRIRQKTNENHDEKIEQNRSIMARIQTEFSLQAQIEKTFRQLFEELHAYDDLSESLIRKNIATIYRDKTPEDLIKQAQTWAFIKTDNGFDIIDKQPFDSKKRKAMSRTFAALINLNAGTHSKTASRRDERFIAGVFGENSVPQ